MAARPRSRRWSRLIRSVPGVGFLKTRIAPAPGRAARAGFALLLGLAVLAGPGGASARTAPPVKPAPKPGPFRVVVVDAGHGGYDDGAKGPDGLLEKNVALDVARRLAVRLRREGLRVVMTRKGDRFVSLHERTEIANRSGANLFISIHVNASHYRSAHGIETYFASLDSTDEAARELARAENRAFGAEAREGSKGDPLAAILGDLAATEHLQESQEFARFAQESMVGPGSAASRGVKQAPFVVLMGVKMPAVLVEIGFLTNPKDERGLHSIRRRNHIADDLAKAVADFRERYDARRGLVAVGGGRR